MISEKLVRSCLYNWLGYGNLNSRIWFIGTEEGGYEIWRAKTKTLEESLALRSKFELSEDLQDIWENKYGIQLNSISKTSTWTFISAFLLGINSELDETDFNNKDTISKKSGDFFRIDKRLGRADSNHFMCELLPLPKKRKGKDSFSPYAHVWKNVKAYHAEILPCRLKSIIDAISNNTNVDLLVSYERTFVDELLKILPGTLIEGWPDECVWHYKRGPVETKPKVGPFMVAKNNEAPQGKRVEKYKLYSLNLGYNRNILTLSTPFFGQGQISYLGLIDAVKRLSSHHGVHFESNITSTIRKYLR
jgi:hypothetical protein